MLLVFNKIRPISLFSTRLTIQNMKPDNELQKEESENPVPISGDVIGDTAYSERFVLKLLLKFAKLDTLKEEINEKSFEEDLCILWDMTAECDVVSFLQKHKILNLFYFALPIVDSPRILEIIIGIIGNMCCQKEVVTDLFNQKELLCTLVEYIGNEDSLVLIQVLRFVNASVFRSDDDSIPMWLELFDKLNYSDILYFILKNSSNKDLLINALENLNTLCSYCNMEKFRTQFFNQFIKVEALESLSSAFVELTITQSECCEKEELERMLVISLQIILTLIGFDKSLELLASRKEDLIIIIEFIFNYYYEKIVNQKEIDTDFTDVIDSTATVVKSFKLSEDCNTDKFFDQTYNIWQALQLTMKSEENGCSHFEEQDKDQLENFTKVIESPLCLLLCRYIEKCSEANLLKVLDRIGSKLDKIISKISDEELKTAIIKRTDNFRSRLKDNVDS